MSEASSIPTANSWTCPLPLADYPNIVLAHGGGGRLMQDLIEHLFVPAFASEELAALGDAAILPPQTGRLALSTDSYVVRPLFFPGSSIGDLAVNGTVNDLAMHGATPLYLTVGFILEEGLPLPVLASVVSRMAAAARIAGVRIVTGDTKVVERGSADQMFINTAGVGVVSDSVALGPSNVRAGDVVIASGTLGDHGMAIMSVREGLEFESVIESDCRSLHGLSAAMLQKAGNDVHMMRDATRGGAAGVLQEIASASRTAIELDEVAIPVRDDVRAACEILGLDPLYVANEGKFVAIVAERCAATLVALLRSLPGGEDACIIGNVRENPKGMVSVRTTMGTRRVLPVALGEQLPRIC